MQYEPLLEETESPTVGPAQEQTNAPPPPAGDPFSTAAREERISLMMLDVIKGEVSRGRSLRYWENLKLKPVHIQMLIMKAAGYPNRAIARQFDYDEARVSVIVNHPDALSILARLVSFQAESLLDIKARIQSHAGEALDTVLTAMRSAEKPVEKAAIGFKLLDRAGYGVVQKVDHSVKFEMPAQEATQLTAALRESQDLEEADWEIVSEHAGQAGGVGDSKEREVSVGTDQTDAVQPPHGDQLEPLRRTA